MSESEGLRIGDLAKATGKSARALRLYEEMGLLTPPMRSAGGFRLYDREAVARVKWIGQLQDLGYTLQHVQDLVAGTATPDVPREAMAEVRRRFHAKLAEVTAQLAHLEGLRDEIQDALAYLDSCEGCTHQGAGVTACVSCTTQETEQPGLLIGVTRSAASSKAKGRGARDANASTSTETHIGSQP